MKLYRHLMALSTDHILILSHSNESTWISSDSWQFITKIEYYPHAPDFTVGSEL